MLVKDLIKKLSLLQQDLPVMILDGFNGSGYPRDINYGPVERLVSLEDGADNCDCEELAGQKVYVIGYGCY